MKKKALLSSILVIVLCISVIAGSTLALFTSVEDVNIAVTAGQVKITASVVNDSLKTWSSLYHTEEDARYDGLFDNNGTAAFDSTQSLIVQRMTPGDVVKFTVHVENESNVNIRYRIRMISEAVDATTTDLTPALVTTAYINGNLYPVTGRENATAWTFIDILDGDTAINDFDITVHFPNTDNSLSEDNRDNQYQNAAAKMTFVIEAVQGNANPEAGHADYAVLPAGDADELLYNGNGYVPEGIFTAEGETVDLNNGLYLNGTTTFTNVTLDANNQTNDGWIFTDIFSTEDNTLILNDNAVIEAKPGDVAILSAMDNGRTFTLMIDESSAIEVSGYNAAAVIVQGFEGNVANIVLNGKASDLIKATNGAVGFMFYGQNELGEQFDASYPYLTVNMFVETASDIADYAALIGYTEGTQINWYVNGTKIG